MATIVINNVSFTNVPRKQNGTKMGNILSQSNVMSGQSTADYIASDAFYKLVNAIDIDWNGAEIDGQVINDTSDLVKWIASKQGKLTKNSGYIQSIYTKSETTPALDVSAAQPQGWSTSYTPLTEAEVSAGKKQWLSISYVDSDNLAGPWSTPICLPQTTIINTPEEVVPIAGPAGGHYEFMYKNSTTVPATPMSGLTKSQMQAEGWTEAAETPDLEHGEVTYMSQCFVDSDGIYGAWSAPCRITGGKGDTGAEGPEGKEGLAIKTYFHVAYANKAANGNITDFSTTDPDGREYIGTYVDTIEADSLDSSVYRWMLVKGAQGETGEQGIPGENGADGKTSYLHIKYSDDGENFTDSNGEVPGNYMGQYVDFIEADSTNFSAYKWALIKGTPGKDGSDGLGINIKGTYDSVDILPVSGNKAGDSYIVGLDLYVWNGTEWKNCGQIKGEDGKDGEPGKDGSNAYLHIAYANSIDGSVDFAVEKQSGVIYSYMGIYTDGNKADSLNYNDYVWSLIKGKDGEDGDPGQDGAPGVSSYFHVAYANKDTDGNIIDFSIDNPAGREYIGTYVDSNLADSETHEAYTWMLIKGAQGEKGEQGIPGKNGEDGSTSYLHIKYSNDGKTFTENNGETPGYYLGQYVDFVEDDSSDFSRYRWVLIKGKDGKDGVGINILGAVDTYAELEAVDTTDLKAGDAYMVDKDLYVWTGSAWKNVGRIKGEDGKDGYEGHDGSSAYLHIAWANSADGITDFTTEQVADKTYAYMGIYCDNVVADSEDHTRYVWTKVLGEDGTDGKDYEFVYTRNNTGIAPDAPATTQTDDWSGQIGDVIWTDHPQGVTVNMQYEYVSTRKKVDGVWQAYSVPVVWSKWGEKGMDGDGIEYIFLVTDSNAIPSGDAYNPTKWTADEGFQQTEYIRSGSAWKDNPQELVQGQYEFVSQRKQLNGVWQAYSIPTLWSYYANDGEDGQDGQSVFKATVYVRMSNTPVLPSPEPLAGTTLNTYINPTSNSYAGKNSEGTNVYWSSDIPSGDNQLWASTRVFTSDGKEPQEDTWSVPYALTDTTDFDVEFAYMQTDDAIPALPSPTNRHGGSGTQIWYDPDLDKVSLDYSRIYWRAERKTENGIAGEWTIYRVKGEQGNPGQAKYASICFIRTDKDISTYSVTGGSYSNPVPTSTIYDNGTDKQWGKTIPIGTDLLWAVTRTFTSDGIGQDESWSSPRRMADSQDYDVQFAYKQPQDATPTQPNSTNSSGTSYPTLQIWYDPSIDANEDYTKMYWCAERYKRNGEWGDWIIHRIQNDGVNGYTVYTNPSAIILHQDIDKANDFGIPEGGIVVNVNVQRAGYSDNQVSEINSVYSYCIEDADFNYQASHNMVYAFAYSETQHPELANNQVVVSGVNYTNDYTFTEGFLVIRAKLLDGTYTTVNVPIVLNMVRQWKESISGDVKTEIATSISKGYEGLADNASISNDKILSLNNIGKYIKSSTEMASTISQTITDASREDASITNFESYIKQTANSISLGVSKEVSDNLGNLKENIAATGIDLEAHAITAKANNFIVKNQNGETTFSIDEDGDINGAGNAGFNGKVTAISGSIGGWLIGDSSIASTVNKDGKYSSIWLNGEEFEDSDGTGQHSIEIAPGGTFAGITSYTRRGNGSPYPINHIGIDGSGYLANKLNGNVDGTTAGIRWDAEGNVTMQGTVEADAGYIGGWTIEKGTLVGNSSAAINFSKIVNVNKTDRVSFSLEGLAFGSLVQGVPVAHSLLNLDGSGQLANGALSWNTEGDITFGGSAIESYLGVSDGGYGTTISRGEIRLTKPDAADPLKEGKLILTPNSLSAYTPYSVITSSTKYGGGIFFDNSEANNAKLVVSSDVDTTSGNSDNNNSVTITPTAISVSDGTNSTMINKEGITADWIWGSTRGAIDVNCIVEEDSEGSVSIAGELSSGSIRVGADPLYKTTIISDDSGCEFVGANFKYSFDKDVEVVGNVSVGGSVTQNSDETLKDKVSDVTITAEQIAEAPAIIYTWKDSTKNKDLHAGTIAQYWQNILPEVVSITNGDKLSMDYPSLGVVNSIILAKEIVSLKSEINRLKEQLGS